MSDVAAKNKKAIDALKHLIKHIESGHDVVGFSANVQMGEPMLIGLSGSRWSSVMSIRLETYKAEVAT